MSNDTIDSFIDRPQMERDIKKVLKMDEQLEAYRFLRTPLMRRFIWFFFKKWLHRRIKRNFK